MNSLLSPPDSKLCAKCQQVLRPRQSGFEKSLNGDNWWRGKHHENGRSFFTAADDGCSLCKILLESHLRCGGTREEEFYTTANIEIYSESGGDSSAFAFLHMERNNQIWQPDGKYTQVRIDVSPKTSAVYERLRGGAHKSTRSLSLNDPTVFSQAKMWLEDCASHLPKHERCNMASASDFVPPRLLKITGTSVQLLQGMPNAVRYATLSYCWGDDGDQALLTTENETNFYCGIMLDTLPGTIRDFMQVAKALDIEYVWVDRLCIIQNGDGGKDWEAHSSMMSLIYTNGFLNVSADRAASAGEGFLGARSWPSIQPVFSSAQMDATEALTPVVITIRNTLDVVLAAEPLASRAWVLSERILSPRTIHFCSGEIFWECSGIKLASEAYPLGFPEIVESFRYASFNFDKTDDEDYRHRQWIDILTNYTLLLLSHPMKDKLVALAGIARHFEEVVGEQLVVGLIRSALPSSLLWMRDYGVDARRSKEYRAPSWTWASMDGPLFFYHSYDFDDRIVRLGRILDISIKMNDERNRFGQVLDGTLVIAGPSLTWPETLEQNKDLADKQRPRILAHWDEFCENEQSGYQSDAVVLDQQHAQVVVLFLTSHPERGIVYGLLLTKMCPEAVQWRRVGMFQSIPPSQECSTSERQRLVDRILGPATEQTFTIV